MSWRKNRRISPVFIGEPTLSWEYLPYHISTREEESLISHKSIKCPVDLKSLLFVEHVFVKKVSSTFWMGCFRRRKNFKITDTRGSTLFSVIKFVENFSFCQSGKFPIRYNFYSEPDVRLILTLRGHPGVFGGGANLSTKLVQSHGKLHLGEIVQENRYCDPIFTLLNPEGFRTLSIQGPEDGNCWGVTKDAEFNLCQHHMDETETEKVVVIGKLRRNYKVKLSDFTKSTLDNMDIGTRCKWSVEFPKDLDPVLKAIVLSGLFLMESQYY